MVQNGRYLLVRDKGQDKRFPVRGWHGTVRGGAGRHVPELDEELGMKATKVAQKCSSRRPNDEPTNRRGHLPREGVSRTERRVRGKRER